MKTALLYPAGTTRACVYAAQHFARAGVAIIDHPAPEITHLLLDVPSFSPDGASRCGNLSQLLRMLPPELTVIGGKLHHPALEGYEKLDLLENESYLAANAALTARCALRLAGERLEVSLFHCPTVVIGWGRIGKCLVRLLRALDADVTVVARNGRDRAMLRALGYPAASVEELDTLAPGTRLLINTAPAPILEGAHLGLWREALKIDLASRQGLLGEDVLWARGLPGVRVPASSGALIAQTVLKEGFQ